MSYDGSSIMGTRLIIVLFCIPHSRSRRVQNSTFCIVACCQSYYDGIWLGWWPRLWLQQQQQKQWWQKPVIDDDDDDGRYKNVVGHGERT